MKHFLTKILSALLLGLVLPQFVFAADIFFEAKINEVRIGEQFEVNLFVNTPEEGINAFEGEITFPNDLVKVEEIRDGNSIVNFWIDKPEVQNGAIVFSGITPGGFQGNKGLFFSVVFETKSEGVARFEINDARVLRNDGTGSQAVLTIAPFEMTISSEASVVVPVVTKVKDIELPESFAPEISRDESIANGKWFVVFATQDKASGIDHYKIKETQQRFLYIFSKWISGESPYVLQDQELKSYVFIKAVDKAGNERIVKINPQNPLGWYENYENWLIVLLGLVIAYIIKNFLWWRHLKK